MAGYPPGSGYPPYGAPPTAPPYGAPNPYGAAAPPYGAQPGQPYGEKPPKDKHGLGASADPYGAQSHGYGAAPAPYGAQPGQPYGEKPPKDKHGLGASADPYGAQSHGYGAAPAPYGAQPGQPYGEKPKKDKYGTGADTGAGAMGGYGAGAGAMGGYGAPQQHAPYGGAPGGYGSPFAMLTPSQFPQGTDPNVVACFQAADRDGSGFIDDKELQAALSSYNQSFSMRTVHLLMYLFTGTNVRKIGPKEFSSVFYSLQNWRGIFERFDRDRSGKIDTNELREALLSLGFSVSPVVLELLVSKFDKSGGKMRAIEYDNFIECCLTVKGLTEKFKEKDLSFSGSATFTYEAFMLTVLPFLIA